MLSSVMKKNIRKRKNDSFNAIPDEWPKMYQRKPKPNFGDPLRFIIVVFCANDDVFLSQLNFLHQFLRFVLLSSFFAPLSWSFFARLTRRHFVCKRASVSVDQAFLSGYKEKCSNKARLFPQGIGTLTLWSACGRSTAGAYHEWQGTVCTGKDPADEGEKTWADSVLVASFICLAFFLRFGWTLFHADLPLYAYHDVSSVSVGWII